MTFFVKLSYTKTCINETALLDAVNRKSPHIESRRGHLTTYRKPAPPTLSRTATMKKRTKLAIFPIEKRTNVTIFIAKKRTRP